MNIDKQVTRFIERHIDLIEANNFQLLYTIAAEQEDPFFPSNQLTRLFEEAGIDVLSHLQHIPPQFYWDDNEIRQFECPNHIQSIGSFAFDCCRNLHHVIINDGCELIDSRAFAGCDSLMYAVIPASVTHIADDAFWDNKQKHFSIVCDEGTTAYEYAEQHRIKWISTDTYNQHIKNSKGFVI